MKLQILIPAYKFIPTETVQSLMVVCANLSQRQDRWNVAFVNSFNPAQARTALMDYVAKQKEDFDYILWIDSDQTFDMTNVDKLVKVLEENNLDCLSAGYYVRDGSKNFAHGRFIDGGKYQKFHKSECNGLTQCDIFGFGFLLMKPQMLKAMVNRFPNDVFKLDCVQNTTEDVYFCRQAQSIGYKLYFDADNVVGHLMTVVTK